MRRNTWWRAPTTRQSGSSPINDHMRVSRYLSGETSHNGTSGELEGTCPITAAFIMHSLDLILDLHPASLSVRTGNSSGL
jgi:hypothetical protein